MDEAGVLVRGAQLVLPGVPGISNSGLPQIFFVVTHGVSTVSVPSTQGGLGVDRAPADVNLEVEVTADADRVAGLADGANALAGIDTLPSVQMSGSRHVSIEVGAILPFAVDEQVVAIEDRVVAVAQDPAVADGDQRRAASCDDVEALVPAATAARGVEFAYVAAGAMRALDREDVIAVGEATIGGSDAGRRGCGKGGS